MIADYKALYLETEKERRQLAKDYLDLAKKIKVVDEENKSLKSENEKLRKVLDEQRKNNCKVVKSK